MDKPNIGKTKYDKKSLGLHDRLRKSIPDHEDVYALCSTLLGCSVQLLQYMEQEIPLEKVPLNVRYAATLIAGNLMAITQPDSISGYMQFPTMPDEIVGEQRDEATYRKMKHILDHLHKVMKENDEVNI